MTTTSVAPRGSVPDEPSLRPRAGRGPGLGVVRSARLFHEPGGGSGGEGALVLRRRSGRERRLPVRDDGGVSSAVYVEGAAPELTDRLGSAPAGTSGLLELRDKAGTVLARIPAEEWLPEAADLRSSPSGADELLKRSGIADLMRTAGIPLRVEKGTAPAPSARMRSLLRELWDPRYWGPGKAFPLWYVVLRTLAFAAWFVLFTIMLFAGSATPWMVVVSAGAVVTAPVARLLLRAGSGWSNRRTRPVALRTLAPCPAPGAGATNRFCRIAAVHVLEQDLVLRDFTGRECWLPLRGPHAVVKLVRVLGRSGGEPLGVEVVGAEGAVRERLTWKWWFGGQGGPANWQDLQKATGLTSTDRRLPGKAQGWEDTRVELLGGVGRLRMSPAEAAKDARRASYFPRTIVTTSSALMLVSAFLLFQQAFGTAGKFSHEAMLEGHTAVKAAVLACALFTVAAMTLPYVLHQLLSRLWLERTAPGQRKAYRR